jgi:uncharacterized membrane protein (DUF106 family)
MYPQLCIKLQFEKEAKIDNSFSKIFPFIFHEFSLLATQTDECRAAFVRAYPGAYSQIISSILLAFLKWYDFLKISFSFVVTKR